MKIVSFQSVVEILAKDYEGFGPEGITIVPLKPPFWTSGLCVVTALTSHVFATMIYEYCRDNDVKIEKLQEIFMNMNVTKNVPDFPVNMQKFCFPSEKYVSQQKQKIKLNLEMTFETGEELTSVGIELYRKALRNVLDQHGFLCDITDHITNQLGKTIDVPSGVFKQTFPLSLTRLELEKV